MDVLYYNVTAIMYAFADWFTTIYFWLTAHGIQFGDAFISFFDLAMYSAVCLVLINVIPISGDGDEENE